MDVLYLNEQFKNCNCGQSHEHTIKGVIIEIDVIHRLGKYLEDYGFHKNILVVADQNTLNAAQGILENLSDYKITKKLFTDLRLAKIEDVNEVERLSKHVDGIVAIGTGSIHDICRLAAHRQNKQLCLFATAASMDGFASSVAPIIEDGFKNTLAAKMPELIIADPNILARAPIDLKRAGFGDIIGKCTALIDWQIESLLSGAYYCEKIATFTKEIMYDVMHLSEQITSNDPLVQEQLMKALVLTGVMISYAKSSRPASGAEHMISHYWECMSLLNHKMVPFHGLKVGTATYMIKSLYESIANINPNNLIETHISGALIKTVFGKLEDTIMEVNRIDMMSKVTHQILIEKWSEIVSVVKNAPSANEIKRHLLQAGCSMSPEELGIDLKYAHNAMQYAHLMRNRISLLRILNTWQSID